MRFQRRCVYVHKCLNGLVEHDFDSNHRISSNVLKLQISYTVGNMCRGRTTFGNVWVCMCHHLDSLHVVQLYSNSVPILESLCFRSYSGHLHCPAKKKLAELLVN